MSPVTESPAEVSTDSAAARNGKGAAAANRGRARSEPSFRIDVGLHDLLMKPPAGPVRPAAPRFDEMSLPEPVYPKVAADFTRTKREYQKLNARRTATAWGLPYLQSLWRKDELRPIIAYLFTEYKCNLDCHYCWSYDNRVRGMSEGVARASIDWLHEIGNRVLALMGGEPLLRPDFVHKVTDYAARKGFFVYLPTNGRLMRPEVIDRLGDAGLAAVNLAVDSVEERPELPKALTPIRSQFDYLVKNQHRYGYLVMLNINITKINMDDVKALTEIAHDNGIGTDYHLNEAPMLAQASFKHTEGNDTFLRPADFDKVDALLDYLLDKHAQGYKMPNPAQHFGRMKRMLRGELDPWPCRAGQNMTIIRTDGTLAPCFPMYSSSYDWGVVADHKFEEEQLTEMKKECSKHCLSTCNYILAHCYNLRRVATWALKQTLNGYRGATGSL